MTRARDNSFNPFNNQAGGKNAVINGAFDFWQRGTSFVGSGNNYTADRWKFTQNGPTNNAYTVSRQAAGLNGFQYCARFQRNSGDTGTGGMFIGYGMASEDLVPLQGKIVTMSFYARSGANFSGTSQNIGFSMPFGTGPGAHPFTGLTNEFGSVGATFTLNNSWQRFYFTATVPSNATEMRFNIAHTPTGTAGAADYYEVTGFQMELGSSPTVFSRAGGTIGGELLLCQRYYYTTTMNKHLGAGRDSGLAFLSKDFPIQMRTIPSFSSNVTTKVANGIFPGTAGQVGFYGDGWIAANGATLACAGDGQTADTGAFYIQGFAITTGKIFSLQTENLTSFNWAAEL